MDFSTRLDRHLTAHLRWYSLIVWIVAAAIAIGPMLEDSHASFLNGRLGDQDDMLRLKQVKDLLGLPDADPKSWYDLREPRIAPPLGLDSHWSRLLDGALALVVLGIKPFAGIEKALWLMQYLWPLALLLPMLWLAYAAGKALHNRTSGLFALLYLALSAHPALMPFQPGRIHHDNLQILLAFAGLYACLRLDGSARRAVAAGLLIALSLAIGSETQPLMAISGLVVTMRYIEHGYRREWTGFLLSVGLGALGLLLVQTGPERMFYPACDALGFNLIAALLAGTATSLTLIGLHRPQTAEHRFRLMFFPVIFALILGLAYDPTCLYDPFGEQAAELRSILLRLAPQVRTMVAGLGGTFGSGGSLGSAMMLGPILGGGLALCILRRRFDHARLVLLGSSLLASGVMTAMMLPSSPYPSIFAAPLIGLGAAMAMEKARLPLERLGVGLGLLATVPLAIASIGFAVMPIKAPLPFAPQSGMKCDRPEDFAILKRQSRGVVAAPLDLAIPVLVMTGHSVTAAPSHRVAETVIRTSRAFAGDQTAFRHYLGQTGAEYVVLCNSPDPETRKGSSVTARLLRGERIEGLSPAGEPPPQGKGRTTARAEPPGLLIWQVSPPEQQ